MYLEGCEMVKKPVIHKQILNVKSRKNLLTELFYLESVLFCALPHILHLRHTQAVQLNRLLLSVHHLQVHDILDYWCVAASIGAEV